MAGMRALGRVYNLVAAASGVGISLRNCSGVGILALNTSASGTISVTAGTTLSGSYANWTTANGFGQPANYYSGTAPSTTAWAKNTTSWSSQTLVGAAGNNNQWYIDFLVSELADTYDYIKVTATGCTITAILYDLTVQRTPENLAITSA
jgi:hypothetical protein